MSAEHGGTEPVSLRWRPAPVALALEGCAALALTLAVLLQRPGPVAFAAPLLGVLMSAGWAPPRVRYAVSVEPPLIRCFVGDPVEFTVRAEPVDGTETARLSWASAAGWQVAPAGVPGRWTVIASRWGRYEPDVRIVVAAAGGLFVGNATARAVELRVYPVVEPVPAGLEPSVLPDRLGTHRSRRIGAGVEFGGVREYVPGDRLRAVNWRVSARRDRLHVTERLAEQAAEVVVLLDTHAQLPGAATQALDLAVRGAVQVVQSALQRGDRAGLVVLGARLRWLAPASGRRQFYRVLDAVLDVGDAHRFGEGTLAPRAGVPRGAVVVAFSTLLDTEFALALIDLHHRGHPVLAVDVLRGDPLEPTADPLLRRMWQLSRLAMYRDMAAVGVDVVPWPADAGLAEVLRTAPDRVRSRR